MPSLHRETVSRSFESRTVSPCRSQLRGASAVMESKSDRICCPACSKDYSCFRGVKRHAIKKHEMRYDNRTRSLVAFETRDALQRAKGVCKQQQRSAHKRRKEKGHVSSGPSHSQTSFGSQVGTRPNSGGQMPGREACAAVSVDNRTSEQSVRTPFFEDISDVEGSNDDAPYFMRNELSPMDVTRVTVSERDTLPSTPVFARSEKSLNSNEGGALLPPTGEKSVRDKVREVWGTKSLPEKSDWSLPRPMDPTPPPTGSASGSPASMSVFVASSDSGVSVIGSHDSNTKSPMGRGQLLSSTSGVSVTGLRGCIARSPMGRGQLLNEYRNQLDVAGTSEFNVLHSCELDDLETVCYSDVESSSSITSSDDSDDDNVSENQAIEVPVVAMEVSNVSDNVKETLNDATGVTETILPEFAMEKINVSKVTDAETANVVNHSTGTNVAFDELDINWPVDFHTTFADLTDQLDRQGPNWESEVAWETPFWSADEILDALTENESASQDWFGSMQETQSHDLPSLDEQASAVGASEMPVTNGLFDLTVQGTNGTITFGELLDIEVANATIEGALLSDVDVRPEAAIVPVPTVIPIVSSVAVSSDRPKLTPPDMYGLRRHGVVSQKNPMLTGGNSEFSETERNLNDPRIQMNFAVDPEPEPKSQPKLGSSRRPIRTKWTQTKPPICVPTSNAGTQIDVLTSNAGTQINALTSNAETQIGISTSDAETQINVLTSNAETQIGTLTNNVETQAGVPTCDVSVQRDFCTKLVNFGLPSGLNLSSVIRMTRQRGVEIGRLVFLLEKEYFEKWQREFTGAERANVWAMVCMAAAVRRDEDREISEWGSSFQAEAQYGNFNVTARDRILNMLREGRNWAIEDDMLYETRSPRVTIIEAPAVTVNDTEGEQSSPESPDNTESAREQGNDDDIYAFPPDYEGPRNRDDDPFW